MQRFMMIIGTLSLLLVSEFVGLRAQTTSPIPYLYRIKSDNCTFAPTARRQTGFRLRDTVGIVTALHGVADCQTISALGEDGTSFVDLVITAVDIEHDMALLTSSILAQQPADGLSLSTLSATAILTASLRVVGYPLGLDKQDVDTIESVRDIESLDDVIPDVEESVDFIKRKSPALTIDVLNLQTQLVPGHSGAPVLDEQDSVVAVGNGGLRGGTVGRSWAIPYQSIVWESVDRPAVKKQLDELAAKDLAALAFSTTYSSAGNDDTQFITYKVRVLNPANQPIADAEVLLTHSAGYEIGITDSEGFSIFQLPTNVSYTQSQVQVEAPGYPSYNRTLANVQNKVGIELVRLPALPPTATPVALLYCEFAFRLLDDITERPIARADLSVTIGGEFDTGKSDSNGFYESKLPCADPHKARVRIRVAANGYAQYSATVVLIGEVEEILLSQVTTPTPTATSTQLPTTLPTATVVPSPTAKRELSYFPVSLTTVANNSTNEGYIASPSGNKRFNDIPFYIADGQNSVTTQAETLQGNPSVIRLVNLDINSPRNAYFLITGGNTRLAFRDQKIGQIRFIFSDNQSYAIDLVAGVNIREWKSYGDHNVNTISGPNAVQVWAGNNRFDASVATIDMLTVDIPPAYQNNSLFAVEIYDLSEQTVGNLNPAINLIAVTILGLQ